MAKTKTAANLGFEKELWEAANTLRGSMDAAEYKHVVLGLIFLKYISDAFEAQQTKLRAQIDQGANPEDPDEYRAVGVFWVPVDARWSNIKNQAKQPTIGQTIDQAMEALERENPSLKSVLPKDYARPALDKTRLGTLIDNVSNIKVGDSEARSKDVLGRVFEYFLQQFAGAEGKKGGEFYTPRCVVKLLVEMLEPYKGRVYDPCCGSSGMFVQSEEFIAAHGGKIDDLSIYGQESNYTTWRLAKMNLAIRGIDGNIKHGDTFHADQHPDLKADYIIANPPFNISDWGGDRLRDDKRWVYGAPPNGNANYAWIQHMIHKLSPTGTAGFVLANGSMSSNQSGEGEIRKRIVEENLVDCIVALPGHLFYSMYSQVCIWFIRRGKTTDNILFIDARSFGSLVDRTHRELSDEEITAISEVYKLWKDNPNNYDDVMGFCKSTNIETVRQRQFNLSPGRYVGSALDDTPAELAEAKTEDLYKNLRISISDLYDRQSTSDSTETNAVNSKLDVEQLCANIHLTTRLLAAKFFRSFFIDYDLDAIQEFGIAASEHANKIELSKTAESAGEVLPEGWRWMEGKSFLKPISERIGDMVAPEFSATVRGLERRDFRFNKSLSKTNSKNKRIESGDLVFGLSRRTLSFGAMREELGSVSPVYEVFRVDGKIVHANYLEYLIRLQMSEFMDILKPGAREGQPIDREYLLGKQFVIPDIASQNIFISVLNGTLRN